VRLTALAPAKVNLCLFLGPVRDDGRHELVTLFESVSLADELIVDTDADRDEVICSGVDGPNLVSAAIEGLRAVGWDGPRVRIEVAKRIPVAAGMGGGSADAAAALRLACELAPGRPEEVAALAASLGADVPSQLAPGLVLGTGAGDIVEPFPPLGEHAFVIVPHRVALSTAEVYREADRLGLPRGADELGRLYDGLLAALGAPASLADAADLDDPPSATDRDTSASSTRLVGYLINDLQAAALSACPEIADSLAAVSGAGAETALVCGSGPTVAGVFWGSDAAGRARIAAHALAPEFTGTTHAVPVGAEFGLPRIA
jgi:4-diphosphocytidyl-2-C-methyl-D-erythritol kinase